MTINAAMPAVAPNQSYTGTAAATDMTGTAGDFSGTLGNMMNARGTVASEAPEMKEVMATGQGVQNGEAVMTAEQTVLMNQLHKELMMKNAGYANGELIAMLLSSTNTELTQLMSFDGELSEEIAMLIEGTEETEILPTMQGDATDIAPVQTESMNFVPKQTEDAPDFMTELTRASDIAEELIPTTEAEATDIPVDVMTDTEQSVKSADIPMVKITEDTTEKAIPETELKAAEKQTGTETAEIPVNTEIPVAMATDVAVKTASDDIPTTDITGGEATEVKATESLSGAEKVISAEDKNQVGRQPMDDNITMKITENTAEGYNVSEKTQDIKTVQQEDITKQSDTAEQTPEMAEDGFDAEITLARAGRRISEKSEEANELAKSISGTKSDSDLETEQKVTVKQELTDGGITENAVKPEFIRKDDIRMQEPVKLTVNEAYQIINEKAAATSNGKQTFTVELTPESLGKITVKMVSENGKISVEILTETETAKQLFEARANELANNLRQNDVEIGSYRVETENEQLFNESFDGSSKNPYAERQQSESSEDEDEFERLISEMMGM